MPGYPQITQNGNAIRILFNGVHYTDPEFCDFPVGTATYPVAAYLAGSYTLQVDLRYPNFAGDFVVETLGIVPFTVTGAATPPVSAPTLNGGGLLILVLALMGFAVCAVRTGPSGLLFAVLLGLPLGARAQTTQPSDQIIEVLVSTASGAPTPQQLVVYYSTKSPTGPPPLQGLTVENPQQVMYLLPIRATGDFLARLQAHPDSVRAKLERYVLVLYPQGANIANALSALRADPYVASAHQPLSMTLSSASLVSFSVGDDVPNGAQYGRTDLNVDAAWQLAGGYALIADIDSGLYVPHPALQQFSGNTYVGGNFIPVDSLDIGFTGIVQNADSPNVDERRPVHITDPNCNPGHADPLSRLAARKYRQRAGTSCAAARAG